MALRGTPAKRKFTVMGTITFQMEHIILAMPTCGTYEAENANEAGGMFQDDQPKARATCIIEHRPSRPYRAHRIAQWCLMAIQMGTALTKKLSRRMNNPLPPPALELTHHAQRGWLGRLVGCVVTLGPKLGWRYWRIEQRAYKHPECVLEWATRCRREAITAPEPYRSYYLDWATQLEDNFEKWSRQEASNGELSRCDES